MKKVTLLLPVLLFLAVITAFNDNSDFPRLQDIESDSLSNDRAKYIALVNEMIKGKEKITADSVYKNLRNIGGFDADILPVVMDKWSIALGVSCGHCHIEGEWEKDDKQEKWVARKMADLSSNINDQLAKIEGIKSEKPVINCATCHQGNLKPPRSVKK